MPNLPKVPKPLRISKIIEGINPLKEIIQDSRDLIRSVRDSISDVASALRVEGVPKVEEPSESESEVGSAPRVEGAPLQLSDLKGFLEKRKIDKALSQLEKDEGDKKKNLETVRKYVEGEDLE